MSSKVKYSLSQLSFLQKSPLSMAPENEHADIIMELKTQMKGSHSSTPHKHDGRKLEHGDSDRNHTASFSTSARQKKQTRFKEEGDMWKRNEGFPSHPPGFAKKAVEEEYTPAWADDGNEPVPDWLDAPVDGESSWVAGAENDLIAKEKADVKKRREETMRKEMLGYDPDTQDKGATALLMNMLQVKKESKPVEPKVEPTPAKSEPAPAPEASPAPKKWDEKAFWQMSVPIPKAEEVTADVDSPVLQDAPVGGSRFDALFEEAAAPPPNPKPTPVELYADGGYSRIDMRARQPERASYGTRINASPSAVPAGGYYNDPRFVQQPRQYQESYRGYDNHAQRPTDPYGSAYRYAEPVRFQEVQPQPIDANGPQLKDLLARYQRGRGSPNRPSPPQQQSPHVTSSQQQGPSQMPPNFLPSWDELHNQQRPRQVPVQPQPFVYQYAARQGPQQQQGYPYVDQYGAIPVNVPPTHAQPPAGMRKQQQYPPQRM